MAAIVKISILPCLGEKLSDFDEIWYVTAYIVPSYSYATKTEIFFKFKIADSRHNENRFSRAMLCMSAAYAVMQCLCVCLSICHVRELCQKE